VGYLCANFSLPRPLLGLSVLDVGPMYATDGRQTDVREASSLNAPTPGAGVIINDTNDGSVHRRVASYSGEEGRVMQLCYHSVRLFVLFGP